MNAMNYTPKGEIDTRIKKLQAGLSAADCGGAIITHHTNLYYFTGTSQSGFLFVPQSGAPLLMIRKSLTRAKAESPIEDIIALASVKKMPALIRGVRGAVPATLGFELDVIPYNIVRFYETIFESVDLVDVAGVVRQQRLIKSPFEIEKMAHACAVLDSVFEKVPAMLRIGMPEIALASLFEAELRKGGFSGNANMRAFNQDFFMGTLVSGASGAVPTYFDGPVGGHGLTPANNPHGAGWKTIKKNELVFIDYTCVVDGYTADQARMFVLGAVSRTLLNAHRVAIDIQKEIVAMAKPGVAAQAVYDCALARAEKEGLADHFMGIGDDRVRFVGHGVGLELDELPVFARGVKMPLAAGMTFAIEPKFVFPEGAVGIENTFVMEPEGIRPLTRSREEIVCL